MPGRTSAAQGPSGRGSWGPGAVFLMILGGGRVPLGGDFGALGAHVFDILWFGCENMTIFRTNV